MLSFFKKPYPYNTFSVRDVYSSFFIGCFIALFLIIFQPFGVTIWHPENKTLKLIGFGAVSFVCPLLFRLMFTLIFNKKHEDEWKVWKEILSLLLVLMFIAFGNLCYGNIIGISHFSVQELALAIAATLLLAVFPITVNVSLKYNRFTVLNQKDAELMELGVKNFQQKNEVLVSEDYNANEITPKELLVLVSENGKEKIELNPDDLIYIESADNYANIVFVKDNKLVKQLIRGSLKGIETQIRFSFIVRCHRSFIVNLKQIKHIKGNAQGYKIEFKTDFCDAIPVSRNYSKAVFERLESLK